jgi:hypothetical protein
LIRKPLRHSSFVLGSGGLRHATLVDTGCLGEHRRAEIVHADIGRQQVYATAGTTLKMFAAGPTVVSLSRRPSPPPPNG